MDPDKTGTAAIKSLRPSRIHRVGKSNALLCPDLHWFECAWYLLRSAADLRCHAARCRRPCWRKSCRNTGRSYVSWSDGGRMRKVLWWRRGGCVWVILHLISKVLMYMFTDWKLFLDAVTTLRCDVSPGASHRRPLVAKRCNCETIQKWPQTYYLPHIWHYL